MVLQAKAPTDPPTASGLGRIHGLPTEETVVGMTEEKILTRTFLPQVPELRDLEVVLLPFVVAHARHQTVGEKICSQPEDHHRAVILHEGRLPEDDPGRRTVQSRGVRLTLNDSETFLPIPHDDLLNANDASRLIEIDLIAIDHLQDEVSRLNEILEEVGKVTDRDREVHHDGGNRTTGRDDLPRRETQEYPQTTPLDDPPLPFIQTE